MAVDELSLLCVVMQSPPQLVHPDLCSIFQRTTGKVPETFRPLEVSTKERRGHLRLVLEAIEMIAHPKHERSFVTLKSLTHFFN